MIQFRRPPLLLFGEARTSTTSTPTGCVLHIQPDEGIEFLVKAKQPGPAVRLSTVKLAFNYKDFGGTSAATGYERLLYDCMIGDATLFHRADMVEAAWKIATPILDVWQTDPPAGLSELPGGLLRTGRGRRADAARGTSVVEPRLKRPPTGQRERRATASPADARPHRRGAAASRDGAPRVHWRRWGPYLSERQWGTVREDYSADGDAWDYFPHDHARSRAYRWGEDGLAGISRQPPAALLRARPLERARSDPQGAAVRAHRQPRAITARTSRSTTSTSTPRRRTPT